MAHRIFGKGLLLAGLLAVQASAEPVKKPVRSIAEFAYIARAKEKPAFKRACAAQLAVFTDNPATNGSEG